MYWRQFIVIVARSMSSYDRNSMFGSIHACKQLMLRRLECKI